MWSHTCNDLNKNKINVKNFFGARCFTKDTQNDIKEWFYPAGNPIQIKDKFKKYISEYFEQIRISTKYYDWLLDY